MEGKRKKDPVYYEIHEKLSELHQVAAQYRSEIEAELATATAESEPYESYVWILNRQLDTLTQFEGLLDDEIWPAVVAVGNWSSNVSHRKSGGFF